MSRQDSPLYVRLPPDLLARIERFRNSQIARPSMVETMRVLVEKGLGEVEKDVNRAVNRSNRA